MDIFIYKENDITFKDEKGKMYHVLYTIKRKLYGNMQLSGARINKQWKYIDLTLPTKVEKLPRDAKRVENTKAIQVWNNQSWGIY